MNTEYLVAFSCTYLESIGAGMSGLDGQRLKGLFILTTHIDAGDQDGKGNRSSIEGGNQGHRDKRPKFALLGPDFICTQGSGTECALVPELRLSSDGSSRVGKMEVVAFQF